MTINATIYKDESGVYCAEVPAMPGCCSDGDTFEEAVSVTGDFQIKFTNLSPTGQDANKDRICIWNVNWDNQPSRAPRRR